MSSAFIGIDPAGVQAWKARLDAKHQQVIAALNEYRLTAQANNEVAHGSHFASINGQCEQITNKQLSDHTDLHAQYTSASDKLVQGIMQVAGG